MLRNVLDWLDHRTGYRAFMNMMLLEEIPGGAKWRYVWGSTLAFVFSIQLITGIMLMFSYSPSAATAWGSVYYIQFEMDFGWLIRGLHHFGSQTMVVLLGLHMLQVVIAGAHLAPREINWWLGIGLMGVVLGLSLTGYLLPWDQKGFWATRVATNIAGDMPVIGPWLQKIIVGGTSYGHHTLSRFFTMHVAVLPGLLIVLVVLHLVAFRRHGITVTKQAAQEPHEMFWPAQAFRDLVVCLLIFGVMLYLVLHGHGYDITEGSAVSAEESSLYDHWAHAGQRGLGANLDAPADPAREYPARPEWYFLFLFQLLKYFEGEQKLIGTVIIPNGVGVVLFLLPLFGYGKMRPLGHILGVLVVTGVLVGAGTLTCLALADDTLDPIARTLLTQAGMVMVPALGGFFLIHMGMLAILPPSAGRNLICWGGAIFNTLLAVAIGGALYAGVAGPVPELVANQVRNHVKEEDPQKIEGIKKFHHDLAQATVSAKLALRLAGQGIPATGDRDVLRNAPEMQFKGLFLANCASCHSYGDFPGPDPKTVQFTTKTTQGFENVKFVASDLAGYGTKERTHALLLNPGSDRFYGRIKDEAGMPVFTDMAEWVSGQRESAGKEGEKKLEDNLGEIAAWLATAPKGKSWENTPHANAWKLFSETYRCTRCHTYDGEGGRKKNSAPDLTEYSGATWLRGMIRSPDHAQRYGANNRMPAFRDLDGLTVTEEKAEYAALVKKDAKDLMLMNLNNINRELLIRALTRDPRVIFGGQPISAPKKKTP